MAARTASSSSSSSASFFAGVIDSTASAASVAAACSASSVLAAEDDDDVVRHRDEGRRLRVVRPEDELLSPVRVTRGPARGECVTQRPLLVGGDLDQAGPAGAAAAAAEVDEPVARHAPEHEEVGRADRCGGGVCAGGDGGHGRIIGDASSSP